MIKVSFKHECARAACLVAATAAIAACTSPKKKPGDVIPGPVLPHEWALGMDFAVDTRTNTLCVYRLVEGGPGERAGIQSGDVVIFLGGEAVHSEAEFEAFVRKVNPGREVPVDVGRWDGEKRHSVVFGEVAKPADAKYRKIPGWEGTRGIASVDFNVIESTPNASWAEPTRQEVPRVWAKTVYPPSAAVSDSGVVPWINCFQVGEITAAMISPDRIGPLEGYSGPVHKAFDAKKFVPGGKTGLEVMAGGTRCWVVADILYVQSEYAPPAAELSQVPSERRLVVEVRRSPPGGTDPPHRSLLLGERKGLLTNVEPWSLCDPRDEVYFADKRLWIPRFRFENNVLTSFEFVERELAPEEAFALKRFAHLPPGDLNDYLIIWKNDVLPGIVREAPTAMLHDWINTIETTMVAANEEAGKERDEATRREKTGMYGAEVHTKLSYAYTTRAELLLAMLQTIKAEYEVRDDR